jgi:hypothetical protein
MSIDEARLRCIRTIRQRRKSMAGAAINEPDDRETSHRGTQSSGVVFSSGHMIRSEGKL